MANGRLSGEQLMWVSTTIGNRWCSLHTMCMFEYVMPWIISNVTVCLQWQLLEFYLSFVVIEERSWQFFVKITGYFTWRLSYDNVYLVSFKLFLELFCSHLLCLLYTGKDPSMDKHTNIPSVILWSTVADDASNSEDGEILLHCDCYSSWKTIMIRFHGKLFMLCVDKHTSVLFIHWGYTLLHHNMLIWLLLGAIMSLAFLLFFPLGIITARHFKSIFEGNIWFKVSVTVCSLCMVPFLYNIHSHTCAHLEL